MIKYRKIRGHNRIWKEIAAWRAYNLNLDLESLKGYGRNYVKIRINPYGNISMNNSEIPAPKGKTRRLILEALIDIYDSWEKQLKTLDQPFYLNIWLYEPNFSNSQVVCAIGPYLNWYDKTFHRPEKQVQIPIQNYGKLQGRLDSFNWKYAHEDNHFSTIDIELTEDEYEDGKTYRDYQKWYKKQLYRNPRTIIDTDGITYYSTQRGVVWLGSKE